MDSICLGMRYLKNFIIFDEDKPLMICLHGNSSSADIFSKFLVICSGKLQAIAIDLPGCGKSKHLETYSYSEIGIQIANLIIVKFNYKKLYIFSHTLAGHLVNFIPLKFDFVVLSGTPPFYHLDIFNNNNDGNRIINLLSKKEKFTNNEATDFIKCQGVNSLNSNLMINAAISTDGKFREGCLLSFLDINYKQEFLKYNNIIIFYATEDNIVNTDYLKSLNKENLFEFKIHYIKGKHMLPMNNSLELFDVIKRALSL